MHSSTHGDTQVQLPVLADVSEGAHAVPARHGAAGARAVAAAGEGVRVCRCVRRRVLRMVVVTAALKVTRRCYIPAASLECVYMRLGERAADHACRAVVLTRVPPVAHTALRSCHTWRSCRYPTASCGTVTWR